MQAPPFRCLPIIARLGQFAASRPQTMGANMRHVLLIGSAALALAACQKSPGASGAAPSASADAGASAPASGTPHRRSGLWTQTMSRDGVTFAMGGVKTCVDEAMEA